MRRLLGSVLPALLLVGVLGVLGGCGDEGSDTVTHDSAPTAGDSPTTDSSGGAGDEVDFDLVQTITETAAGGSLSPTAVPLGDDAAVQKFTGQFENDAMPTKVQQAVDATDVPHGELLYGAVVSIGCDSPDSVSVTSTDQGLVIAADQVPNPQLECFAPMTTVALVLVPASAVS